MRFLGTEPKGDFFYFMIFTGVFLFVGYVFLDVILDPDTRGCLPISPAGFYDVAGYDFEAIEEYCRLPHIRDITRIYASKTGKSDKTLIMEYEGGSMSKEIPPGSISITSTDDATITIAVRGVANVLRGEDRIGGMPIVYVVDREDYFPKNGRRRNINDLH